MDYFLLCHRADLMEEGGACRGDSGVEPAISPPLLDGLRPECEAVMRALFCRVDRYVRIFALIRPFSSGNNPAIGFVDASIILPVHGPPSQIFRLCLLDWAQELFELVVSSPYFVRTAGFPS